MLATVLPLVEAPKNVFLGLFVLIWCVLSLRQNNWGGRQNAWDGNFAALAIAATVSTVASPFFVPDWKEFGDIASYLLLGWMCSRTRFSERQMRIIAAWLIAATVLGILHGLWMMQVDPKRISLQLHSVGQTNHSALYVMGVIGIALAFTTPYLQSLRASWRRGAVLLLLALMVSMMIFGSRGALITCLLVALPFLWLHQKRRPLPLRKLLLVCLCVMAAGLYFKRDMIVKTRINLSAEGSITAMRGETAHSAIESWRQSPLTGVGPGHQPDVTRDMIESWVGARGEPFYPNRYTYNLHAHNLYFNTLAERGLLGLSALLGFAFLWARQLILRRPTPADPPIVWSCWGAGLSGFMLVFAGGMFNTTLHHEHALLAMLCLALMLSTPSQDKTR